MKALIRVLVLLFTAVVLLSLTSCQAMLRYNDKKFHGYYSPHRNVNCKYYVPKN